MCDARGPWTYCRSDTIGGEWWDVKDESGDYISTDITEADARLIAAAPQMLAALRLAAMELAAWAPIPGDKLGANAEDVKTAARAVASVDAAIDVATRGRGAMSHRDASHLHRASQRSPRPTIVDWQPIDTAPRDGVAVLLSDYEGCISAGLWVERGFGWVNTDGGELIEWDPSHWAPMPQGPTPNTEGGQR